MAIPEQLSWVQRLQQFRREEHPEFVRRRGPFQEAAPAAPEAEAPAGDVQQPLQERAQSSRSRSHNVPAKRGACLCILIGLLRKREAPQVFRDEGVREDRAGFFA